MITMTNRIGSKNVNKYGTIMEIIKYDDARNIVVKFENGDEIHTTFHHFNSGDVKSLYDKTICGIGYLGVGRHCDHKNIFSQNQYRIWKGMIERCYKHYHENRNYVYNKCSVCDDWLNFQNFADWYDENYYEIPDNQICLDKDILIKGNKIYSPETCCFVPQNINKLFTKTDKNRGKYPIGVTWEKKANAFRSQCNNGSKKQYFLGYYNSEEKAFNVYKKFKEKLIKEIADEYKNKIPKILYEALYTYEVEMTD